MAGKIKKTMIYLGLADDDESLEDSRTSSPSTAPAESRGSSAAGHRTQNDDDARAAREAVDRAAAQREQDQRAHEAQQRSVQDARSRQAPVWPRETPAASQSHSEQREATVTPLKPASEYHDEESTVHQITTIHPKSYNDAKLIGDSFRRSIPVIMNVTDIQESEAKRLVDFSAGLVFGLNGKISRVTNKVFLLTPEEIDVNAQGSDDDSNDDDPILVTR
jgi:cell division inhibitor SepF